MIPEIPPANGVIIHPGAVGDCLLTLPLAFFMKKALQLRRLDFIGRMDAIEFYPGRTCIDRVRSLDSIQMHRLFEDENAFVLEDKDRLATAFEGYDQIVSFLGYGHPHFEKNLLFCVHSTHSAEVVMLPLTPAADDPRHASDFYVELFRQEQRLDEDVPQPVQRVLPFASDFEAGRDLLEQAGVQTGTPLAMIQPGSGAREKCWHLQNFLYVADALNKQGIGPVFLLGPVEQERFTARDIKRLSDQWPVLADLSLTRALQALTQADVYLGNDSGISHLAAAVGRPAVVLFGPASSAVHYRPLGERVTVLQLSAQSFCSFDGTESDNVVEAITVRL